MARKTPPVESRRPSWGRYAGYLFLAVLFVAFFFGGQIIALYTDWLWFQELGQTGVYRGTISAKLLLFFGFGTLFFLICYANVWTAMRLNASRPRPRLIEMDRPDIKEIAQRFTRAITLIGAFILAFLVGGNAATHWSDYLLFTHAGTFGQTDPVFSQDIGFYVFRLPFLQYLQGWLVFTLIVTILATAAVHYSSGAIDFIAGSVPTFAVYVRKHLLVLLGLLALAFAWSYHLSRYQLLFTDNNAYFGAGYTDLHARLPVLYVLAGAMALTAFLCFANIWTGRAFRLPLVGLGLWAIIWILGGGVYPSIIQRFTVVPNQINREREYIARDIEYTRRAYGLDRIREQRMNATEIVTAAEIAENQVTIDNIRLWDWPQLGAVYSIKQALRNYYRFTLPPNATFTTGDFNIDVGRYRINNQLRQVMLAPRELAHEGLPPEARTWVNLRLQYTHGYGIVMSPSDRVDPSGLPEYYVGQIPVTSTVPELQVNRPQIYYGELTQEYAFVGTAQPEFDYPSDQGNQETRYAGKGGIVLDGFLRRLAFAMRLGDTNMLLSRDLIPGSRLLFRRAIRERVQTLAPFLNWDNDPYMVVDNGNLIWMMDAYTVTDRYPYSRPFLVGTGFEEIGQRFNYIRNSVKAVVDAYDGTVTFYIADAADPIVQTWARVFPGLFRTFGQMPASLRNHVRYPEDLFRIQRDLYTTYHMTEVQSFYQKEDKWMIPLDPTPQTDSGGEVVAGAGSRRMQPYYVIMRLPGAKQEEFLLMTPFTPLRTQNLAAWMAAKCDPENYGQLLVYRFPEGININGPQQVIAQINSQEDISRYVTLVGQRGSRVIFGNLLIIPVGNSLLYAVPLYVQATSAGAVPQITQVIAASGNRIVMRPTLQNAIAALGEGRVAGTGSAPPAGATTAPPAGGAPPSRTEAPPVTSNASPGELMRRAQSAFEKAREKQREYDSALEDLGRALQELERRLPK